MTLQGFQFLQIASQVATKESHSKLFCAFYDVFIKDFAGKSKKLIVFYACLLGTEGCDLTF